MLATFEYVLPAIRGIQAGREYYISMCPLRFLSKLFPVVETETVPEKRAQRKINKSRVSQMARYILENPKDYTMGAIAALIDADVTFEPIGAEAEELKLGRLRVPMDAKFAIADGQYRRAAFELALKQNPNLGYETVAVIFFLDLGLQKSQQMFLDLNRYGVHPDPSLEILYDWRDRRTMLTKAVIERVDAFRLLTEMERSNIPVRSNKLFTLYSLHQAMLALLVNCQDWSLDQQITVAVDYWKAVTMGFPEWEAVVQNRVRAMDIREKYVYGEAIALMALGQVGARLLSVYPKSWGDRVFRFTELNWLRVNPEWQDRILIKGGVNLSSVCVSRMVDYLTKFLGLPLESEVTAGL